MVPPPSTVSPSKVDKRATKTEIKTEIKKLYGVDVVSVNTLRQKANRFARARPANTSKRRASKGHCQA